MAIENDVVLIHLEDNPLSFARVESILPDSKPDWYHIKLLLLQIPLQTVTWILRDTYINGTEFTMNGKRMRIEYVEAPVAEPVEPVATKRETLAKTSLATLPQSPRREPKPRDIKPVNPKPAPAKSTGSPKVISLADRIKK